MRYFITSDVHSYYTPLKKALDSVGYDSKNLEHTLVILGDLFDRGSETKVLCNFLQNIPQAQLYLVRGNHECLLDELLKKAEPDSYDFSNGTVYTCCQLAYKSAKVAEKNYRILQELNYDWSWQSIYKALSTDTDIYFAKSVLKDKWSDIKQRVLSSELYEWYSSLQWHNCWEFDKYIGVHSFVPVQIDKANAESLSALSIIYNNKVDCLQPNNNWREANSSGWELATWGCPYQFYDHGLFPEQDTKTLICGHFGSSYFHSHYETNVANVNDIYYSQGLIALDSTVAISGQSNILVIDEDGNCFDQYNNKLGGD